MKYKVIESHPRYEISKEGIIRNRNNKKIKSQYVSGTGYYMVSFSYNNKSKPQRVHRLLAKTFIDNPKKYRFINHKDGDKLNNELHNLEWCTHTENMRHAFRTGLVNNSGENNGMNKLSIGQVKEIKELLKSGMSQYKIAEKYPVSRSTILKIKLGKTWRDV